LCTGNEEGDDMSGGVHLSAVDTIDLDRKSGSIAGNSKFAWEAWEYVGSGGGGNEFIVRGRYKLTLASTESITQAVSSISNINDCIPFITGIFTDQITDDADHATAIAWISGSGTLNVKRGSGSNDTTGSWTDVGASATWEFATSSVTDGADITASLSTSDVNGQYAKSNPTTTNINSASVGQDIEYDFHLIGTNISDAKRYSFRVVESDGTVFDTYSNCPTLTTEPGTANFLRHGLFFSDEIKKAFFWAN
jgi:hypothetical protein